MPPPTVKFDKTGPDLEVEVTIGYIVAASFDVSTWAGTTQTDQMSGVNDVATHSCALTPASAYDGQIAAWDIIIGQMTGGDTQYLASVSVRQGGKALYTHAFHASFGSQNKIEIYGGVLLAGT